MMAKENLSFKEKPQRQSQNPLESLRFTQAEAGGLLDENVVYKFK